MPTILDYVITVIWLSPLMYFSGLALGKIYHSKRKSALTKTNVSSDKKIDRIIFQIPTVGNVQSVNRIIETVKKYEVSIPLETWVVIEESNTHKSEYVCDRLVVVPTNFDCEDLYKGRALEYARRLRLQLVDEGKLEPHYLLVQGDDDALPSADFIKESLTINADISIGAITPKPAGVWNTILDYERCVACGIFCNFFTNIGKPLWAHGEGTWLNYKVDAAVSYDISPYTHTKKEKLISSEDSFYFHKASILGFTIFNSDKKIYIVPPLSFKDAIKQRRRWVWGELRILNQKMLPLPNRLRLGFVGFSGLWLYSVAMLGVPLNLLHVFTIPALLLIPTYGAFVLWFAMRAYVIGAAMGWKHGIAGAAASYITVTLNFITHLTGLVMGDPKKFEVIRKD